MQNGFKYFAFVSFQSSDAQEAIRLQHAIERYRLPAVLCKNDSSVPRYIKPLYCYLNDMHAGEELMMELKARMEQSHYLIVVCSPRAAKSAYINSGIDYFISLGRRDCIIPIIVDGIPYSNNPDTECFPDALKRHFPKHSDPLQDHSILGINIHEAGIGSHRQAYDRAMLMVVARILQLDFDGLLLRDQQRRRRRTILWTCLSLLMMAAIGLTWFYSQTVDVSVRVEEATPHNAFLPPCSDIAMCMYLENEQKTDTLATVDDTAVLTNIPPRYIGREVRMTLTAKDFLPLDTTLVLQKVVTLPIHRDPTIYGHVHFHLIDLPHPENARITIADYQVQADANGLVELDIPITDQQQKYVVTIDDRVDTLYMPCGSDVVL